MKKVFLIAFVLSLVVLAVVFISILLFGNFEGMTLKILFSLLSVGGYSLTALASATLMEKYNDSLVALAGIVCSVAGFISINYTIWGSYTVFSPTLESTFVPMILSIALGHICLLLHIKPETCLVRWSLSGTILAISMVALMMVNLLLNQGAFGYYIDSNYFRLLGAFAVLDVLGTITTPILNKVFRNK